MVYCTEFLAIKEAPRSRMIRLPKKKCEKLFSLEKLNSTIWIFCSIDQAFIKWSHIRYNQNNTIKVLIWEGKSSDDDEKARILALWKVTIIRTLGVDGASSVILRTGWHRMMRTTCGANFIKASLTHATSCSLQLQ